MPKRAQACNGVKGPASVAGLSVAAMGSGACEQITCCPPVLSAACRQQADNLQHETTCLPQARSCLHTDLHIVAWLSSPGSQIASTHCTGPDHRSSTCAPACRHLAILPPAFWSTFSFHPTGGPCTAYAAVAIHIAQESRAGAVRWPDRLPIASSCTH